MQYPMTGTRAMEARAFGLDGTRDDRLHRGRNVVGSFLMQGASDPSLNSCGLA